MQSTTPSTAARVQVTLRADVAARPQEVQKPTTPQQRGRSGSRSATAVASADAAAPPMQTTTASAASKSSTTTVPPRGSTNLNMPPGGGSTTARSGGYVIAAAAEGSRPASPVQQPGSAAARPQTVAAVAALVGGGSSSGITPTRGGAYLALPQSREHRATFLDAFLGGAWVRHYAFAMNDAALLYYCLQPGRFGALYPSQTGPGMATLVVDIHSRLALHVPLLLNESVMRTEAHPHVSTFYEEPAEVISLTEAQRLCGSVLRGIIAYIAEINRLRSEGLPPVYVSSAYVLAPEENSVNADTKFVYLRRVFPDPDNTFTLFRLSNFRSQVICPTMLIDIRWACDKRQAIGMRYYVHNDGRCEPFATDHTGVLARLEHVLSTTYHR
jgi:hypothetical protein